MYMWTCGGGGGGGVIQEKTTTNKPTKLKISPAMSRQVCLTDWTQGTERPTTQS